MRPTLQCPSPRCNILSLLESSLCFKVCEGPAELPVAISSALTRGRKFYCCVNLNVSCCCFLGRIFNRYPASALSMSVHLFFNYLKLILIHGGETLSLLNYEPVVYDLIHCAILKEYSLKGCWPSSPQDNRFLSHTCLCTVPCLPYVSSSPLFKYTMNNGAILTLPYESCRDCLFL